MQKISSYLYPNKINVVVDDPVFYVRWNIVYQNRVKVYQGVDNVLTIDVKNSDQKRVDISGMSMEMKIMDVNRLELATIPLVNSETLGLATVTVTSSMLADVDPQFLVFSIYRINEDETRTVLYADTQFGAVGNMELIGSINPIENTARYITTWTDITNDTVTPWETTWYSDAVEIKKLNFLTAAGQDTVSFDFVFNNLDATVTVEYTKNPVISAGIIWEAVDTFAVNPTVTSISKTYSYVSGTYNREWAWARVTYIRATNNTGSIDKVIVRL